MKVGVLTDTKDREEGSGTAAAFSEEAGGPLIPSASVWALDRLSGLWDSGQWGNRQSWSPTSPYTSCCFPHSWQRFTSFTEGSGCAAS